MNIIVKPTGSALCYCRPDTTWERENKDFYSPECVNEIYWTPVVFARISKAGKCIGDRFAQRYYDAFNFGALLYCSDTEGTIDTAYSSCIDHTSLLPVPLYNIVVMEAEENTYTVCRNGDQVFRQHSGAGLKELIEDALCKASRLTSLRIGDYVAVELAPQALLASRKDGEISISATYCDNDIFSLKIIF